MMMMKVDRVTSECFRSESEEDLHHLPGKTLKRRTVRKTGPHLSSWLTNIMCTPVCYMIVM